MLKKLLAVLAFLCATAAFAADVNKASVADLDGIKGIGPKLSSRILEERKKGAFKDWADLTSRVKGIGDGNAQKFSDAGLTVNGTAYKPSAPKSPAKGESKPMPKPAASAPRKSASEPRK